MGGRGKTLVGKILFESAYFLFLYGSSHTPLLLLLYMFRPFLLCFFSIRSHKFRGGTVVGWWGGTEIHAAAELCSSAEKYETQNAQLLENVKSRAHDKEHGVGLSRWEKESVTQR